METDLGLGGSDSDGTVDRVAFVLAGREGKGIDLRPTYWPLVTVLYTSANQLWRDPA